MLLGEPVFDAGGLEIDYASPIEGTPQSLDSLDDDQKNAVLDKLSQRAAEIAALAETFSKNSDSEKVRLGKNLRDALVVPSSDCIYVINDQPVLVAWGFKTRGAVAAFDTVEAWRLQTTRPAPDPVPQAYPVPLSEPPADDPSFGATRSQTKNKFPWLFLLLLLAGLFLLMFLFSLFFGFMGSDRNHNASPSATRSPSATTTNDQHGGTSKAQGREANGMSDGGDLSAEQETSSPSPEGASADGGDSLPQTGLPQHRSVSAGENQGGQEEMQQFLDEESPNDLQVPQDAMIQEDVSFLQGEWISITNLISSVSKESVIIHYRFDAQGNGTTTIIQDRTKRCTAPVKARFEGTDRLYIEDQADVICSSTAYFPKSTVICDIDRGGKAVCHARQGQNIYDVSFRRR